MELQPTIDFLTSILQMPASDRNTQWFLDTLRYVAPTDIMTVMTGLPKTELVT